jgi:hypothetical protein
LATNEVNHRGAVRIPSMTTKERLLQAVLDLPETEVQPTLEFIASRNEDPVIAAFRDAEEDDEPWTDEDEAAMAEVRADEAAGASRIPFEEIKAKYGLA